MTDTPSPPASARTVQANLVALEPGRMIGRYQIMGLLGQGSFGITYRARDTQLGREVAIKEYLPSSLAVRRGGSTVLPRSTEVADDFTWGRDRFVAEGRTLASLHEAPAIVRVHDFLEANGTAYLVMELLRGETLERRIRQSGPLSPDEIDAILWPLLDGLEQVHAEGFLHRDIKPANILLNSAGKPTLIDFGASRVAMAGRTTAMTAVFTPGYAAAEQFASAKQGPWTDIYGLAATIYHAVAGKPPPSAFDRMLDDACEPLAGLRPAGFARGLLVGIDAGLAVRANERPQSIAGWRPILRQESADTDATVVMRAARPSAPPSPAAPPAVAAPIAARRNRLSLYAGLAVAILAIAVGGYFMLTDRPVPQVTALRDLKVEDLERALAERRAADAAAAEKKRLEEEAQRQADADAKAKEAADADLAKAREQRQKAEAELAKLKTDMEGRRQAEAAQRDQAAAAARRALEEAEQRNKAETELAALRKADEEAKQQAAAASAARQQADEAAQRKAEAEAAALRQAEEDARQKAVAEAEAKRQADEALTRAQAERKRADEEAARQKAEVEARQKADVEAAAVAEKKSAEAAEAGLRLATTDRQRVQVALTSLGFDTRGSDGAFGPRSREMITGWQKARNQPTTGFLTGPQHQALLREAAPALSRYDEAQKKIDDEKKKAEEEARTKTAAAASAAPPTPSAPAPGIGAYDGTYGGVFGAAGGPRPMTVHVANGNGSGTFTSPQCGTATVSIQISAAGDVSGGGTGFDQTCSKVPISVRGRAANGRLQLNLSGSIRGGTATLVLGVAAPVHEPAPPTPPPQGR